MPKHHLTSSLRIASIVLLGAASWGCAPDATSPLELTADFAKPVAQTPIAATVTFAGGSVAGDILGAAYSNNVCGVLARVFQAGSSFVDVNLQTDNKQAGDRSCTGLGGTSASVPRKLTVTYPDNSATQIGHGGLTVDEIGSVGVGATQAKPMGLRIEGSSTRRCASLGFGNNVGGQPVSVTRNTATTWTITASGLTARCTPPRGAAYNIAGFNFAFTVTIP